MLEILEFMKGFDIQNIISILAIVYFFIRKTKKEISLELNEIKVAVLETKEDIKSIDRRLTFMEGAFHERGQWESKAYKIDRNLTEFEDK